MLLWEQEHMLSNLLVVTGGRVAVTHHSWSGTNCSPEGLKLPAGGVRRCPKARKLTSLHCLNHSAAALFACALDIPGVFDLAQHILAESQMRIWARTRGPVVRLGL